jgi:Cu/Ag efflux pump CusA
VVNGYPGIDHQIHTYLQERVQAVQASDRDIVLRIYGTNQDELLATGNNVLGILSNIDGVADARVETGATSPEFHVEVDLSKAEQYGLTPGEVRRTATTLVTGLEVGSLFEEQKVFEVVVMGVPEIRQSQTTIENIMIHTPSGELIRLADVATVSLSPASVIIPHESISRYVDVTANVVGRPVNSVATELENGIDGLAFPIETHAELLSTYTEEQSAWRELLYAVLAAIVGIFLIIQATFGSWRLAIMNAITLPAAMVGGLVMAFLFERDVTLGVVLGLIVIFSITARQALALISRAVNLRDQDDLEFGAGLVQRATQERFAPILLTTLATAVALAPFTVRGTIPGLEILHPMAVVALGGLVTSVLVTLFIVPSLYLRFAPSVSARGIEDTPPYVAPAPSSAAD